MLLVSVTISVKRKLLTGQTIPTILKKKSTTTACGLTFQQKKHTHLEVGSKPRYPKMTIQKVLKKTTKKEGYHPQEATCLVRTTTQQPQPLHNKTHQKTQRTSHTPQQKKNMHKTPRSPPQKKKKVGTPIFPPPKATNGSRGVGRHVSGLWPGDLPRGCRLVVVVWTEKAKQIP